MNVERVFRHTTLRLCFFHLNQSSLRKIQELGLQVAYIDENDTTIRQFFDELPFLAFVPVEDALECLRTVLHTTPRRMTDFVKYFKATYIGIPARGRRPGAQARYPPQLWNQFQAARANEPRTNNNTEAWHNRFQNIVAKKHPSVYKLIHYLKKEQADVDIMIRNWI